MTANAIHGLNSNHGDQSVSIKGEFAVFSVDANSTMHNQGNCKAVLFGKNLTNRAHINSALLPATADMVT